MSDAGEIIGRLKLDASDWMAELEAAKGEAETLKGIDPKIQVTADTAGAIAGLSAVTASADKVAVAQERLRLATQSSDRATASAMLAQMRLTDVQDKRGRTAYQVAAAEEALRVATERADNAAIKAIAAEDQLAAARRDAAKAALEEGAAAEVAGDKATGAAKGPIPWMGILVGSIAAVSPGIVAAGAAAVGLTADLGGLAVAGVLAFKGIAAEMAAGSDLGNKYSDMVAGLQTDLSLLEHTAAAGIFAGLSSGVKTLEADIGPLNQDVSLLSGQLGGLLASTATTAVHALAGFTPVLLASGTAFQGFLQGIDGFTTSNGFTAFIDYTVARLPDVMHLIDSTLGALGGIFSALAPAGQSTLFMLSSLMDLITALSPTIGALMPTVIGLSDAIGGIALVLGGLLNALGPFGPVLVGTTAAFIGLGFAARALAPAVLAAADAEGVAAAATRGLGAAVDFAAGPFGLILIAAGLLASALATMGSSAEDSTASVQALTSAVQQDNGVVGTNTKTLVANNLASAGAFDAAQRLGLSTKVLTAASTGQAAALKQVNAVVADHASHINAATQAYYRYHVPLTQAQQDAEKVKTAVAGQNEALKKATDQYNKIAVATGNAKVSQQQMAAAANAVHMPVDQFAAAAAAQGKAADAAEKTRNQYILLGDAANLLKLDMDKLNGASISNAEAQAAWASGLDSLKSSLKKTKDGLDGNSRAAVENRGAIASLVSTGETALQSFANQTHSVSQTTAQYKSMRSELINQISAITGNRTAAAKLVDQYFKIPKNIKTDFQGDDRDAKAKAAAAKKAAEEFAKGNYKAAYKADPTPANKAKADAMQQAREFANGHYLAQLLANHVPASSAAQIAKNAAQTFSRDHYEATLYANNGPALSTAAATVAQINSMSATIAVTASAQAGRNYRLTGGAYGGTVGSDGFGGIPHMAGGGTITGAGNAHNDMAGLFYAANSEELISNKRGQADWSRSYLKAINSQQVRNPAQLAQMAGGGQQPAQVHVHVTSKPGAPDLTDYIDVRVSHAQSARDRQDEFAFQLGMQDRMLVAGAPA